MTVRSGAFRGRRPVGRQPSRPPPDPDPRPPGADRAADLPAEGGGPWAGPDGPVAAAGARAAGRRAPDADRPRPHDPLGQRRRRPAGDRRRPAQTAHGAGGRPGGGASLWIPVSRYSRSDLAPVVVKDSTGAVVPRFTHRDSNRVTAAAFVRLLSMLIDAHHDVTARGHGRPQAPAHPPAVALADRGGDRRAGDRGLAAARPASAPRSTTPAADRPTGRRRRAGGRRAGGPRPRAGRARRRCARRRPQRDPLLPFAHLLQLACSQYMLVVLLDAAHPRRFLTWDAPLLPGRTPERAAAALRAERAAGQPRVRRSSTRP